MRLLINSKLISQKTKTYQPVQTQMEAPPPSTTTLFTRIRLANATDVPHIHKLIHKLAIFENLTHLFQATTTSLSATLFPPNQPPPFSSFTVFLLEISHIPFTPQKTQNLDFTPVLNSFQLQSPIIDLEKEIFATYDETDVTVVGFMLFFPNYSMFLAKPGFHVEGVLVRECYRRKGLGKMLFSAVAAEAVRLGHGRVDWVVLDWNVDAVKFYQGIGADVMQDYRLCRLSGERLQAYAH